MESKVKDATIKSIDKFYEIEKQCFEREAFSKKQIAYLLTDYSAIGLAAQINGEIAGFIIGRIDIARNTPFGHILTVDVAAPYRRKGIAQKLIQGIEIAFKERSIKECRLEVREENLTALNLYEKLGYKKVGKLEKYYGDTHGLYLKKTL